MAKKHLLLGVLVVLLGLTVVTARRPVNKTELAEKLEEREAKAEDKDAAEEDALSDLENAMDRAVKHAKVFADLVDEQQARMEQQLKRGRGGLSYKGGNGHLPEARLPGEVDHTDLSGRDVDFLARYVLTDSNKKVVKLPPPKGKPFKHPHPTKMMDEAIADTNRQLKAVKALIHANVTERLNAALSIGTDPDLDDEDDDDQSDDIPVAKAVKSSANITNAEYEKLLKTLNTAVGSAKRNATATAKGGKKKKKEKKQEKKNKDKSVNKTAPATPQKKAKKTKLATPPQYNTTANAKPKKQKKQRVKKPKSQQNTTATAEPAQPVASATNTTDPADWTPA